MNAAQMPRIGAGCEFAQMFESGSHKIFRCRIYLIDIAVYMLYDFLMTWCE
jgi:hypothetical protein